MSERNEQSGTPRTVGAYGETFSPLAWELARSAFIQGSKYDKPGPDHPPVNASIVTSYGTTLEAWGNTSTEAMRHLAELLDRWAAS